MEKSLWILLQPREPRAGSVLSRARAVESEHGHTAAMCTRCTIPTFSHTTHRALCDALPGGWRRAAEPGVLWLGSRGSEIWAVLRTEQRTETTGWVCTGVESPISALGVLGRNSSRQSLPSPSLHRHNLFQFPCVSNKQEHTPPAPCTHPEQQH